MLGLATLLYKKDKFHWRRRVVHARDAHDLNHYVSWEMHFIFTTTLSAIVSLSLAQTPTTVAAKNTAPFKVLQTFEVGGDEGWDCVTVDSE